LSIAELVESCTLLPEDLETQLVCPRCKCRLTLRRLEARCSHPGCGGTYPIRQQVPVLFNESNSVFSTAGVLRGEDQPFVEKRGRLRRFLSRHAPTLAYNACAKAHYHRFAQEICDLSASPRVLVIGSRVLGTGMEVLEDYPQLQIVESDVELGARPQVVFDAHDIPFEDGTFDGVIAQAVLEHVADPVRVVSELVRVLSPRGIVYAETPFMQQVHEGAYDFTRFTHLGHRRLFRDFDEIESGIACGPGMALGWAWQYFLTSFARSKRTRMLATAVARSTGFFWKYFDPWLSQRPAAYDAASGFYFLGRRSQRRLSDRQLIAQYRGAVR